MNYDEKFKKQMEEYEKKKKAEIDQKINEQMAKDTEFKQAYKEINADLLKGLERDKKLREKISHDFYLMVNKYKIATQEEMSFISEVFGNNVDVLNAVIYARTCHKYDNFDDYAAARDKYPDPEEWKKYLLMDCNSNWRDEPKKYRIYNSEEYKLYRKD